MIGPDRLAPSTIRGYHQTLRLFCDYLLDGRYDWVEQCEQRFGMIPSQACHDFNTAAHLVEYEGRPERRPFSYDELQHLFDHVDTRIERAQRSGRKGALAALRDAQMIKTAYAFIVQVQMLGEGFDHPRLSVGAIFRPFRSLAPYIQFVGRVMRVVQQNKPDHPDNQGTVVSHVGLNNDGRWSEFRELDLEDQELIHGWVVGEEINLEPTEPTGEPRSRRFDGGMLVNDEILTSFIDQAYLDPSDDRVLEEMLAKEVAPGLTLGDIVPLEQLRAALLEQQAARAAHVPTAIPVSPQRRRQSARKRLNQRAGAVANRVLDELHLPRQGRQLAKLLKGPMAPNSQVVIRQLNKAVTAEVNNDRGEASGSAARIGDSC